MTNRDPEHYLTAGQLARHAGVSTDTLRHYERKGVIPRPDRQTNGYRMYATEALARIQIVRRALAIGFTLDELAEILRVRDTGGVPCRKVRDLAAAKLASVDKRLRELSTLRDELRAVLKDWDMRLSKTPPHQRSRLLESLNFSEAIMSPKQKLFTTTAAKLKRNSKQ